MPLPHVFPITKYDPADRDGYGRYHGPEDVTSDHGVVEAAYLAAMAAFAEDADVTRLAIREPLLPAIVTFGVEAPIEGYGLAGLFPPDLTGFHDGAERHRRGDVEACPQARRHRDHPAGRRTP
jgi:hypothetical protein